MDIEILYEDADLIVCVKPAGVAVETKQISQQDMVSLMRNYRSRKNEETYIGLIHRLDQPVEGILVFAKHAKAAAALSRQLAKGAFTKKYLAVAQGSMPKHEGTLEHYVKKDCRRQTAYVTDAQEPQAKRAQLMYQVLETMTADTNPNADSQNNFAADFSKETVYSLVNIKLITGRFHQIRVQMASVGAPLAGDLKYNPACSKTKNAGGLALCAYELQFEHPAKKNKLTFHITPTSPLFHQFQAMQNFGISSKI